MRGESAFSGKSGEMFRCPKDSRVGEGLSSE